MLKQIFNLTRLMLEVLGMVFCRTRATAHTTAGTISHAGQARGSHASLIETRSVMKFFRAGNDTRILPSGMFGAEGRKGVKRILRRSRAPCARKRKTIRSPAPAFGRECVMRARWLPLELAVISESHFGIA